MQQDTVGWLNLLITISRFAINQIGQMLLMYFLSHLLSNLGLKIYYHCFPVPLLLSNVWVAFTCDNRASVQIFMLWEGEKCKFSPHGIWMQTKRNCSRVVTIVLTTQIRYMQFVNCTAHSARRNGLLVPQDKIL